MTINDYVINTTEVENIVRNSVGIVKEVKQDSVIVFFIGTKKEIEVNNNQVQPLDVHRTGDEYPYKICNVCHILKDVDQFDYNQNNINRRVRRPSCKDCRVIIDGKNMSTEDKRRMERIKPTILFTCPICHKSSIPFVTGKIVIDHDHNTGIPRSWICDSCNTGLGRFKDNIEILQNCIDYLNSFENKKEKNNQI